MDDGRAEGRPVRNCRAKSRLWLGAAAKQPNGRRNLRMHPRKGGFVSNSVAEPEFAGTMFFECSNTYDQLPQKCSSASLLKGAFSFDTQCKSIKGISRRQQTHMGHGAYLQILPDSLSRFVSLNILLLFGKKDIC